MVVVLLDNRMQVPEPLDDSGKRLSKFRKGLDDLLDHRLFIRRVDYDAAFLTQRFEQRLRPSPAWFGLIAMKKLVMNDLSGLELDVIRPLYGNRLIRSCGRIPRHCQHHCLEI